MGNQTSQSEPTASFITTIEAPIEPLWKMIREYGTWATWWPMYKSMEIIGDGKDEVGAIRAFTTLDGTVYEEKLVERDDVNHVFRYDFVSRKPALPIIKNITSTVVLEEMTPEKTKISWLSWTEVSAFAPAGFDLQTITNLQKKAYESGVKSLYQHLYFEKISHIVLNFLNNKRMSLAQNLMIGQGKIWGYESYPEEFGKLPKMVKGLPLTEVITPQRLGQMNTALLEIGFLQAKKLIFGGGAIGEFPMDSRKDPLDLVASGKSHPIHTVELTKYVMDTWEDDAEFCQQLLQGVNPLHIQVVNNLKQVPVDMRGLEAQGKSVKELITENRLFIVDYKELIDIEGMYPRVMCAPILLVYKELLDNHKSRLNILGIQLEREKEGNTIYTPQMAHKRRYKLAKMFVGCADNHIHEFGYHLAIGHLAMEPIAVGVHNCLPEGSPLRILLQPHLEGTIAINFLARESLIADKGAFVEKVFSSGRDGGLKIASRIYEHYDFFGFSFPEQLKARGFDEEKSDGLDSYYYRDDGFLLWHAIGDYTSTVVSHLYKDDGAVKNDANVQKWAAEMSSTEKNGAAIPSFPKEICTKKLLSTVLQIIIWNGSALHTSVGSSQWPYTTFGPNRPNAIYMPMPPDDGKDITEEYLQKAMSPPFALLFHMTLTWLLSLPSDTNLSDLSVMKDICPEADAKFQIRLAEVTDQIKLRNEKLRQQGKPGYIFLLPENVAASVDI